VPLRKNQEGGKASKHRSQAKIEIQEKVSGLHKKDGINSGKRLLQNDLKTRSRRRGIETKQTTTKGRGLFPAGPHKPVAV